MGASASPREIFHASAVAIDGRGVVLLGASGSGKSSLTARLLQICEGEFIGDDRLVLDEQDGQIFASPHDTLRGLLELRGLGVVRRAYISRAPIHLAVELCAREDVARMAPADWFTYGEGRVARLRLHAHDSATPMIIQTALKALGGAAAKNNAFSDDGIYEI